MNAGLLGAAGTVTSWRGNQIDHARSIFPVSNVGYNSIGNITDGNDGSATTATSAARPQYVLLDLCVPRQVSRAKIIWNDTDHRTVAGSIQYSTNGVAWQDAYVISGNGAVSIDVKFGPITARYWRLYSTSTGWDGFYGVDIKTIALFNW